MGGGGLGNWRETHRLRQFRVEKSKFGSMGGAGRRSEEKSVDSSPRRNGGQTIDKLILGICRVARSACV